MAQEPYLPAKYRGMSEKEIRKEYSRLRSIAKKRLERMAGTEYADSQIYRLHVEMFKPLSQIDDWREQTFLLTNLVNFLSADTSTVKGAKLYTRQKIRELQNAGYEFVTDYRSLTDFTDFMRASRAAQGKMQVISSDEVAKFYRELLKQDLAPDEMGEEFYKWMDGRELVREQNLKISEILEDAFGEL